MPNFIILRQIVLELWWKQTDGRTDGQADIQDDRIKQSYGIFNKKDKLMKGKEVIRRIFIFIFCVCLCIYIDLEYVGGQLDNSKDPLGSPSFHQMETLPLPTMIINGSRYLTRQGSLWVGSDMESYWVNTRTLLLFSLHIPTYYCMVRSTQYGTWIRGSMWFCSCTYYRQLHSTSLRCSKLWIRDATSIHCIFSAVVPFIEFLPFSGFPKMHLQIIT